MRRISLTLELNDVAESKRFDATPDSIIVGSFLRSWDAVQVSSSGAYTRSRLELPPVVRNGLEVWDLDGATLTINAPAFCEICDNWISHDEERL